MSPLVSILMTVHNRGRANRLISEFALKVELVLKDKLNDVDVQIKENKWTEEEFDVKRWKISEQVVLLSGLFEKKELVRDENF